MGILISDLKVWPQPVAPGGLLTATCRVESDSPLESVMVVDPLGRQHLFYDDGTHGDQVAGDGIYTLMETVPYDAPPGIHYLTLVARDQSGRVAYLTGSITIG